MKSHLGLIDKYEFKFHPLAAENLTLKMVGFFQKNNMKFNNSFMMILKPIFDK